LGFGAVAAGGWQYSTRCDTLADDVEMVWLSTLLKRAEL
jgi:hypothetical protein